MKKVYVAPELELVRYTLKDVILSSLPTEDSLSEKFGGGLDEDMLDEEI